MNTKRALDRIVTAAFVTAVWAVSSAALAQHMPADLNAESGARLPYLTRQDLGEGGRRLSDIFARNGQPGDPISGPLAFAAYNIPVAIALLDLHDGAIGGTLDAHARELAIMVACRETNYTLEWNAHKQAALNAGVTSGVLNIVRDNKSLNSLSETDATIIRFGRELLRDRKMSSATFASAVKLFGEHGAMDLVAVMSTYAVSGFYAIAVDEHPPGEPMLEPLE
ncbi:MAG: hypothetical protein PVF50_07980 [Gammaproteobacteria bacterium]